MDRTTGATGGSSVPYGQACSACYKAKSRCIARPGGNTCERCHRLGKACTPSDSVRRRTIHKVAAPDNRISELENKIDSLVSLLSSVAAAPNASPALQNAASSFQLNGEICANIPLHLAKSQSPPQPPSQSQTPHGDSTGTSSHYGTSTGSSIHVPSSHSSPQTGSSFDLALSLHEQASEAEPAATLKFFLTQSLPLFPIFDVPPDISTHQFARQHPYLFRAILAVASSSSASKCARSQEYKRMVFQAHLEARGDLDFLLSLLTYVAWNVDEFFNKFCGKPADLSRMIMMAMAVVYNNRWHITPHDFKTAQELVPHKFDPSEAEGATPKERQRAVLGCFALSSAVARAFETIDPMQWTPYMEQALQSLDVASSCPGDKILAYHVRLQLLTEQHYEIRNQRQLQLVRSQSVGSQAMRSPPSDATGGLPICIYIKSLNTQLQSLKASMPTNLPRLQQQSFLATIIFIEFSILDVLCPFAPFFDGDTLCLDEALENVNVQPIVSSGAGTFPSTYDRLELTWRGLNAVKEWFDIFIALPTESIPAFTFHIWEQCTRAFVMLAKLTFWEDPLWDQKLVLQTLDILAILDQMRANTEKASRLHGEQDAGDLLQRMTRLIWVLKVGCAAKLGRPVEDFAGAPASNGQDEDGFTTCAIHLGHKIARAQGQEHEMQPDVWAGAPMPMAIDPDETMSMLQSFGLDYNDTWVQGFMAGLNSTGDTPAN